MAIQKNIIETGNRYGRWTVMAFSHTQPVGFKWWLCRCDCGAEKAVRQHALRHGISSSCGCYRTEFFTKHGYAKTTTWSIWMGMKNRCNRPSSQDYHRYGARGIKVCDRWLDFRNFLADMGPRPSPKHSIDRFPNNDGNYEPGNCRWATEREQSLNKSTTLRLTHEGITLTLVEWAEKLDISWDALWGRIYTHGWSVERALTQRPRSRQ